MALRSFDEIVAGVKAAESPAPGSLLTRVEPKRNLLQEFTEESAKGIARGFLGVGSGLVGTATEAGRLLLKPLYSDLSPELKSQADQFGENIGRINENILAQRKALPRDADTAAGWGGAVVSESLAYLGASAVGGGYAKGLKVLSKLPAAVRAAIGAAGVAFAVEGEQAAQSAKESGATEVQQNLERVMVGVPSAALEAIQVGQILKVSKSAAPSLQAFKTAVIKHAWKGAAKQGGKITGDVLLNSLAEGATEVGQQTMSQIAPAIVRGQYPQNEDGTINWHQIFKEDLESFLGGAFAGGVFTAAHLASRSDTTPVAEPVRTLEQADMEVRARRTYEFNEKKDGKYADKLVKDYGIERDEAIQIIEDGKAEELKDAPLSDNEQADVVRLQIGQENVSTLEVYAGSKHKQEVVDDVLRWNYNYGGMPVDPDARTAMMSDMREAAIIRRKQYGRIDKATNKGREANVLNSYQPIRYALTAMELASGKPLASRYSRMNTLANEARTRAQAAMEVAFEEAGIKEGRVDLTSEENNNIAEWLFEEDEAVWNKMSEGNQALALSLQGLLQSRGAHLVRALRWKLWNKAGVVPEGISEDVKPEDILKEGQQAELEGRLDEWLQSQRWGTREKYYMSDNPDLGVDEVLESLSPTDPLRTSPDRRVGKTPGEIQARRGKPVWKRGSVINNIHSHMARLESSLAVFEDLSQFWPDFLLANPSKQDQHHMQQFINAVIGRSVDFTPGAALIKGLRKVFWRYHLANPLRGLYRWVRDLHQVTYVGSQLSPTTLAASGRSLVSQSVTQKHDPDRVAAFQENWEHNISQKQKMWQQFMLMEEGNIIGTVNKRLWDKLNYKLDQLGSLSLTSDSISRVAGWNSFYQASKNEMSKYTSGRTTWAQLESNLRLNTLTLSQRAELRTLTDRPADFHKKFAEWKTENVFFKYETPLRSAMEQNTLARGLFGLTVYPRGVLNMIWQGGYLPLVRGIQTGDFGKAEKGMKVLIGHILASGLARHVLKRFTGKDDYDTLPQYTMLDPGIGTLVSLSNSAFQIIHRGEQEGWSKAKTAEAIAAMSVNRLDFMLWMADSAVDLYEASNDLSGVTLWKLVKSQLNAKYKRKYKKEWDKQDRSTYQKLAHVLFAGGFEQVEERE